MEQYGPLLIKGALKSLEGNLCAHPVCKSSPSPLLTWVHYSVD